MSEFTNIEGPDGDELAWRAFRYLHGEMTADEAEAFEEDLAVEQPAREALAQAARLTAALEAAGDAARTPSQTARTEQPPSKQGAPAAFPRRRWSRRQLSGAGIVGGAVAACLALMVTLGVMGHFRQKRPIDPVPTSAPDGQADLAKAWAGIGGDWHEVVATLPMPFSPEGDGAEEDRLHGDHETEVSVPQVSSWLLAALDPQPDDTPEIKDIKEIKQ